MNGARIFLGVSGGIAAYKAAALTSTLVQRGAVVDVVMTAEAERFVTPLTFASLTARPVYTSLWDAPERIPHIRLVREADVALVAPATANIIAKLAAGIADDLLTTALLAARVPRLLAPAMNDAMYEDPATQANIAALRTRGYEIVEPERGFLAEREVGVGRLASEERLLGALEGALARRAALRDKRVAITAGPTREAFDPIRFLSNASSGATGIELAREAALRGAQVTLLLGPTLLEPPAGVDVVRITTASELYDAALAARGGRRPHDRNGGRRRLAPRAALRREGEEDRRGSHGAADAQPRRARGAGTPQGLRILGWLRGRNGPPRGARAREAAREEPGCDRGERRVGRTRFRRGR